MVVRVRKHRRVSKLSSREKRSLNSKAVFGNLTMEDLHKYLGHKVMDIDTGEIYTVDGISSYYGAKLDLSSPHGYRTDVWVDRR